MLPAPDDHEARPLARYQPCPARSKNPRKNLPVHDVIWRALGSNPSGSAHPRSRVAPTIAALASILCLTATGCGAFSTEPVVNAGSSVPVLERAEPDPFLVLRDESPVAAYEYGACSSDADCVTDACNGATCAPARETMGVCLTSRVSACLATLEDSSCGCVEGYCRWARNAATLTCANRDDFRPSTRQYVGVEQPTLYPVMLME